MNIDNILNKIYLLPEVSKSNILKVITENKYSKGSNLLNANKVERDIYFIKEGIVRAYTYLPDNEITFWLHITGCVIYFCNSDIYNRA